jgi:hypothetical protein
MSTKILDGRSEHWDDRKPESRLCKKQIKKDVTACRVAISEKMVHTYCVG